MNILSSLILFCCALFVCFRHCGAVWRWASAAAVETRPERSRRRNGSRNRSRERRAATASLTSHFLSNPQASQLASSSGMVTSSCWNLAPPHKVMISDNDLSVIFLIYFILQWNSITKTVIICNIITVIYVITILWPNAKPYKKAQQTWSSYKKLNCNIY